MALNPHARGALRKFSTRSGSDSGGGEKSVPIVKQRTLRRIIQAKRQIVKQTKEKARRGTKKMGSAPQSGRRRAEEVEFSVLRDVCYDLSETHIVLFLSYL